MFASQRHRRMPAPPGVSDLDTLLSFLDDKKKRGAYLQELRDTMAQCERLLEAVDDLSAIKEMKRAAEQERLKARTTVEEAEAQANKMVDDATVRINAKASEREKELDDREQKLDLYRHEIAASRKKLTDDQRKKTADWNKREAAAAQLEAKANALMAEAEAAADEIEKDERLLISREAAVADREAAIAGFAKHLGKEAGK